MRLEKIAQLLPSSVRWGTSEDSDGCCVEDEGAGVGAGDIVAADDDEADDNAEGEAVGGAEGDADLVERRDEDVAADLVAEGLRRVSTVIVYWIMLTSVIRAERTN